MSPPVHAAVAAAAPPQCTSSRLRDTVHLVIMALLYASQGVIGGVSQTAPMLILHASPTTTVTSLGLLGLAGYVSSVKFLWAPAVDTLYFGRSGRSRRVQWIVVLQALMAVLFLWLMTNLGNSAFTEAAIGTLVVVLFALSFCSSTQDVAVDAWVVEGLQDDSWVTMAGSTQMLGMMMGSTCMMILAERHMSSVPVNWLNATTSGTGNASSILFNSTNNASTSASEASLQRFLSLFMPEVVMPLTILGFALSVTLGGGVLSVVRFLIMGSTTAEQAAATTSEAGAVAASENDDRVAKEATAKDANGSKPSGRKSASQGLSRLLSAYRNMPTLLRRPGVVAIGKILITRGVVASTMQLATLKLLKKGINKSEVARMRMASSFLSATTAFIAPKIVKRYGTVQVMRFTTALEFGFSCCGVAMYTAVTMGWFDVSNVVWYYMWPETLLRIAFGSMAFVAVATLINEEGMKPDVGGLAGTTITALNAMANFGYVVPMTLVTLSSDWVERTIRSAAISVWGDGGSSTLRATTTGSYAGLNSEGGLGEESFWIGALRATDAIFVVVPCAWALGIWCRRKIVLPALRDLDKLQKVKDD